MKNFLLRVVWFIWLNLFVNGWTQRPSWSANLDSLAWNVRSDDYWIVNISFPSSWIIPLGVLNWTLKFCNPVPDSEGILSVPVIDVSEIRSTLFREIVPIFTDPGFKLAGGRGGFTLGFSKIVRDTTEPFAAENGETDVIPFVWLVFELGIVPCWVAWGWDTELVWVVVLVDQGLIDEDMVLGLAWA